MTLRKIATTLVATGLVVGLIGAGISAQFTYQGEVKQEISVGVLGFTITSTDGTVVGDTVTCPPILIEDSSGSGPTCNATLTSSGTIAPKHLSVQMTSTTTGADLGSFKVSPTGLAGMTPTVLSTSQTSLAWAESPIAFPVVVDLPISWGRIAGLPELDNGDMGKTIVVTYQFNSAQ